ncbi:MAG: hypothetical protein R2864_12250 [Syntrophotaleaceae bacterium]
MQKPVWRLTMRLLIVSLFCLGGLHGFPAQSAAADKDGRELFQQHCAICHPGGGNIINPNKTLGRKLWPPAASYPLEISLRPCGSLDRE